jgi:hypothetical protein
MSNHEEIFGMVDYAQLVYHNAGVDSMGSSPFKLAV